MNSLNGRVIVAGAANAGKTCLIERFVRNVYVGDNADHAPTVGCDCLQKSVLVDDTQVFLYLYDTAGQERFADMSASYFRKGDVCLLVFDLQDMSSFNHIKWWRSKVSDYNNKCSFILVGCKEDLLDYDHSSNNDGTTNSSADLLSTNEKLAVMNKWSESNGIPFFTTSAKKGGPSIQFLFYSVAEKCIRQNREREILSSGTGRKPIVVDTRTTFGKPRENEGQQKAGGGCGGSCQQG